MSTIVDDAPLRSARRDRVFTAMDRAGLDVLVLGRRDSVAYATGARSLWTAGTRPFGATCVLVGAGRSTYLLTTWDAGVPPEVPFEHLYGLTWNPAIMSASLAAIPGLAEARRLGVDALSPGFERAAGRLAPRAELVPADGLLRTVRAVKLPDEIERIRAAVAVAAAGVGAAAAALADGAPPGQARAAAVAALAGRGATVPASAPIVETGGPAGRAGYVDIGVIVAGYEGGLGRAVGEAAGADAVESVQRALVGRCRPGATAGDVRDAAGSAGDWLVRGSGLGFEWPVISPSLGAGVVLQAGMVLSVQVEARGVRRRDLVLIGADDTTCF